MGKKVNSHGVFFLKKRNNLNFVTGNVSGINQNKVLNYEQNLRKMTFSDNYVKDSCKFYNILFNI